MVATNFIFKASLTDLQNNDSELDFFLFGYGVNEIESLTLEELLKVAIDRLRERPVCKNDWRAESFVRNFEAYALLKSVSSDSGAEYLLGDHVESEGLSLTVTEVDWEILGFDHIAIAVKSLSKTRELYRSLGAVVKSVTKDSNPGEASSMKLDEIHWGGARIGTIEAISRQEISQVESFIWTHGNHSIQHGALSVRNLDSFVVDMKKVGAQFRGPILEREDIFGRKLKQIFGCIFDEDQEPDEGEFYEFVERPPDFSSGELYENRDFSHDVAAKLARQISEAQRKGDKRTFFEAVEKDFGNTEL